MKTLFPLLLLVLGLAQASGSDLKISDTEPLMVTAPDGWTVRAGPPAKGPFPFPTASLVPPNNRNAVCLISVLDKNKPAFNDADVLKNLLRGECRPYLPAPEDWARVKTRSLLIAGALGIAASFTDPSLIGKTAKPGSYKTATPVILSIGTEYLIKATILCDDLQGRDFAEALLLLQSIKVGKPKA